MKEKYLVSVIMSEYNTDPELLKGSISSILNQTYKNIELIIIDDCSKNNVKKIIEEFNDKRIKYYKNKKNSGLVYSLNKAISYSNGKYIARMDTDDYSYQDRIEKQVLFLETNNEIDILGGNCDFYDGNKIWGKSNFDNEITREILLSRCPFLHPSVMMKKDAIKKINGYLDYNRAEDYATWIEMFVRGYKLYNLNDTLIRYHLSYEDYKKRTLSHRKGFYKMLNEEYIKLKPTKLELIKIKIKTLIAGLMPAYIMFNYHKRKNQIRKE